MSDNSKYSISMEIPIQPEHLTIEKEVKTKLQQDNKYVTQCIIKGRQKDPFFKMDFDLYKEMEM
jgi:hypothetical protein